ncbi:hypothetical protein BN14_00437 [Rhizoctonia solani AG-1 IB]|uniref:Uncharacterized protein n=1 Tax=Thanatephorus cucumeris (strain AG1-IB / isolate 7/3/14) TaxID=1108050 RepID=M5BIS7_THACB|nr:hypothetical protein BN14_00437 [Rhizoctonia solani AG-1 IB]
MMLIYLYRKPHGLVEPVPSVPPLPNRAPERKSSSFFSRTRSGSTPPATETTERAHTPGQPSTGLESIQLPISANSRSQTTDVEVKYRGSVPLTLVSPLQVDSPDSWVRVGGVGRESGLPTSPTTRRRAVSVPLPPQQSTEPPPPMPDVQLSKHDPNSGPTGAPSEPVRMHRSDTSTECDSYRSHNSRGTSSAFVSGSDLARSNTNAYSGEQEGPALRHGKKSSVGTSEGLVLKSALKHRPVESSQGNLNALIQPVKPLKICKREVVPSRTDSSQLPTPSSESSLNNLQRPSVAHKDGTRSTTQHHKSISGSSLGRSLSEVSIGSYGVSATEEKPATSLESSGSFNHIMKGHGLSSSDSRSLPFAPT